jgi:hypothetical protein
VRPDLALLVGRRESGGDGDTNVALIVAVAVVVPVAVAFVLLVVVASSLYAVHRRRASARAHGAVHFDRESDHPEEGL